MIVIGHQHVGVKAQLQLFAQLRQQFQKMRPVGVSKEDGLTGVATVGNVLPQARPIASPGTAHPQDVPSARLWVQGTCSMLRCDPKRW
jgi:hypothetical protein